MPAYNNPDFRRPPLGLAAVFAAAGRQSFFSLPEWYDLLGGCLTSEGSEIRVYTDERPGSMVAVPMQAGARQRPGCVTSLANFYSVEHGVIAAADANLDVGLTSILSEISIERPRWNCLKFAELDPRDASYQA